jgi:nucleoside-diphosphate-sugar epimerase
VERGDNVRVLARKLDSPALAGLDVEVVRGSVEDVEAVKSAVSGVDRVYHLAAAYRSAGIANQAYHSIHVKGTENVMEAALRQGVSRVVHCSTVGVHGHIDHPPAAETYRFSPGDVYQETKLIGEQVAWRYYRERGLPVSVIRPTAIYGPGDLRLLKLFKIAFRTRPIILGNGKVYYHMVYVQDLVQGFLLAGEKKEAVGESFIVGGEECLALEDLIGLIREVMGLHETGVIKLPAAPLQWAGSICERLCVPFGIEPPIYRRRVDFFTKSRSFDISKAKRLLGYEPKTDLRAGLKQTGMAYRESGLL